MAESKYLKKVQGNGASTTLSGSVSAVATSAPLTADTAFAGEGMVIIDEGQATEEFAYATAKVGSSLTILADDRGLEGGSAQAHASTATVKGIVTAGMWNNLITGVTNVLVNTTGALDTTKVVDLTTAQTLTNKTLTSPKIGTNIKDTNGNELITLTATGSAVNEITYANAATGNAPSITASGDDTNIDLNLKGKGTGEAKIYNYDDSTYYSAGEFLNNSIYRQAIINGNFDVWQRGTSFSASAYTADRWYSGIGTGGSPAATISQQAFTVGQTSVPNNPTYYYQHNQTAQATSTAPILSQPIENVSNFSSQTITTSVWMKCSASTVVVTPKITQYFGSGGSASVDTAAGATYTVTTSWQKFTTTYTVPSITGKTVGAGNYLSLTFSFPLSSTYTVQVAQVQLCVGSVALPFMPKSYDDELRACQRYYHRITASDANARFAQGVGNGTTVVNAMFTLPTMRIIPTPGTSGNLGTWDGASIIAITGQAAGAPSLTTFTWNFTVAAGITAGKYYQIIANSAATAYIDFSAEL